MKLFIVILVMVATATARPLDNEPYSELQKLLYPVFQEMEEQGHRMTEDRPAAKYQGYHTIENHPAAEYEGLHTMENRPAAKYQGYHTMEDRPVAKYQAQFLFSYRETHLMGVESLQVGQSIEVVYRTPSSGRVSVSLYGVETGDVVLFADARFDWLKFKNAFLLNTHKGTWQEEVYPTGFPFPAEGTITTIDFRIRVGENDFIISANGAEIATFPFRGTLTPDKVVAVECGLGDYGASQMAVLEKFSITF